MGGGISLMEGAEGVEQLMTTALMIGRAISAVAFPGMYRIYDFHSKKAPKLKNGQKFTPFFNTDSDDEEEEDYVEPDPANYAHFFHVKVGGDTIYIEDPLLENEAGWTALHACCMSLQTVEAGLEIIEEMSRRGGHFDTKTVSGPGTFNRGWTALQMACAYGVEPLVEKLVEVGADVNAVNSFGYSCMLEACHRGYIVVAKHLLQGDRVDLAYIPDEELAANSPFASAPCQSALAEAARSGFFKVVQTLLDAGAPKDLGNRIGWTALHEACFYNRMETVKTLLLGGASATVRTKQGALPYHLACIPDIRNMLESMGGPEAVPSPGDTIDMLMILTELTMGDFNTATFQLLTGGDDDDEDLEERQAAAPSSGSKTMASIKFEPQSSSSSSAQPKSAISEDSEEKSAKAAHRDRGVLSPLKEATIKTTGGVSREEAESGGVQPALLHSGPLLGNLPAFGKNTASPKKFQTDIDHALLSSHSNAGHSGGIFGNPAGPGMKSPSKRADDKTGGKKKKKKSHDDVPKDTPVEFLCQLTQRLMSEPVKTIYGNVYDRTAIMNWLSTQGKICPLTGAPLSESDLTPNEELGHEIKRWIIMRSTTAANSTVSSSTPESAAVATSGPANDDLYDF